MFSNKSVIAPRSGKPHIVYRQGYWRVSPLRKPITLLKHQRFDQAHSFISRLNNFRFRSEGLDVLRG